MKKKLSLFYCATLMLALGFSSCGDNTAKPWSKTEIEEMVTSNATATYFDLANPTFDLVADAIDCQEITKDVYSVDSIFRTMPQSILRKVADVCINKSGSTDKKQIVQEFNKNKDVYLNMSENLPPASSKNDKSATDSGGSDVTKGDSAKVFETSFNYYTDTIGGKPIKVQVKTIKSYVN